MAEVAHLKCARCRFESVHPDMSKHDYHSFTDGGALLRPHRISRGIYAIDEELGVRAVAYLRSHTEDAELLIEILGLVGYGDES